MIFLYFNQFKKKKLIMCGFIVHYNLKKNSSINKKLIKASKEIQHRGPDDMSTFFIKA